MVFKTIKACYTQTLHVTLKPKYFIKPWYFSKTPKILSIQTGPNSMKDSTLVLDLIINVSLSNFVDIRPRAQD
jgi:hypothetical protein